MHPRLCQGRLRNPAVAEGQHAGRVQRCRDAGSRAEGGRQCSLAVPGQRTGDEVLSPAGSVSTAEPGRPSAMRNHSDSTTIGDHC